MAASKLILTHQGMFGHSDSYYSVRINDRRINTPEFPSVEKAIRQEGECLVDGKKASFWKGVDSNRVYVINRQGVVHLMSRLLKATPAEKAAVCVYNTSARGKK